MKKGNKLWFYISSITFCCLFMLFFSVNKIKALDESAFVSTCVDRDSEASCSVSTVDAYFVLEEINIGDETVTSLTIPSSASIEIEGVTISGNIEVLGDGVKSVINSDSKLNLESLTLPDNLVVINSKSLENISNIDSVLIPSSVKEIKNNVLEENSNIEEMYLNHYSFPGAQYIVIDSNAFENVTITRIISENHGAYKFYTTDVDSTLKDRNIVTVITYNYYAYEKVSHSNNYVFKSINYYAGSNQLLEGEVPVAGNEDTIEIPEGLIFEGWYVLNGGVYNKVELGKAAKWDLYTKEYNVYPRYQLKPVSADIVALSASGDEIMSGEIQYNGSENLVTLLVKDFQIEGELTLTPSSYTWYMFGQQEALKDKQGNTISSDSLVLAYANQTGTYYCDIGYAIVINEQEYTGILRKQIYIMIKRAPLYVTISDVSKVYGEYLSDDDITYSINGLLASDGVWNTVDNKYDGVTPTYNYMKQGNINVGVYLNSIKMEAISIIDELGEHKESNYAISYSHGDYKVTKKLIDVYYDTNVRIEYDGGKFVASKTYYDYDVYGNDNYDNTIVVTFVKNSIHDKDTHQDHLECYGIVGVKEVSNPNYNVRFVSELSNGQIIIDKRRVETNYTIDSLVYDGNVKKLQVYYLDINDVKIELAYLIRKDGEVVDNIVGAGNYMIEINSLPDSNYTFLNNNERRIAITISKALPRVIYSSYQTFTYTGEKIYPTATINNDEQTPIFNCMLGNLQGNYCVNVGSYSVVVTYKESENYSELTLSAITLNINRYTVSVAPREFVFYYGEDVTLSEEIEILGEKVVVNYSTNADNKSIVGNYDITGVTAKDSYSSANHPNYQVTLNLNDSIGKVKIVKRPVTLVYYNYEGLIYNGKERYIGVYAIDEISKDRVDLNINVICDEGEIKDSKTYHIRSYFTSDIYEATNSNLLTFSIGKANYDLSNIKFSDQKFTWNFQKHGITIEGELPQGVSVNYTIDGKEGNSTSRGFSHKVVATFSIDGVNYYPIESMEATIYVDVTWVFIAIFVVLILAGIAVCLVIMYLRYRRTHHKKIKLKIKQLVEEDLQAKRVATSVKDVLGDEEQVETEYIESEDDIIEGNTTQSFIDRIYASDHELKTYYSEVKNELLSYSGITYGVDRKYEIFSHGTRQIAKLSICNGVLRLYVNLDPTKYDVNQYNHRDMSKFEVHAKTPLRIDVCSAESLRHAKVFIRILRKKENLKSVSNFVRIDYEKFYTLKENVLVKSFKKMFNNKKK